jgi:hypothetical protein
MTWSLCNIVLNYIGNTWWNKDIHLNGIGYGVMDVLPNLRVASHGISCFDSQILLRVAKCYGFFW